MDDAEQVARKWAIEARLNSNELVQDVARLLRRFATKAVSEYASKLTFLEKRSGGPFGAAIRGAIEGCIVLAKKTEDGTVTTTRLVSEVLTATLEGLDLPKPEPVTPRYIVCHVGTFADPDAAGCFQLFERRGLASMSYFKATGVPNDPVPASRAIERLEALQKADDA